MILTKSDGIKTSINYFYNKISFKISTMMNVFQLNRKPYFTDMDISLYFTIYYLSGNN